MSYFQVPPANLQHWNTYETLNKEKRDKEAGFLQSVFASFTLFVSFLCCKKHLLYLCCVSGCRIWSEADLRTGPTWFIIHILISKNWWTCCPYPDKFLVSFCFCAIFDVFKIMVCFVFVFVLSCSDRPPKIESWQIIEFLLICPI